MQFLTSLLGGSADMLVTSALALGAVLVLIVLGLWALKFFMNTGTALRPQGRRLQVVDQMQVDAKRQLLIVRRDNVEHLILTGGPQDLVIENGIPVTEKPALPLRRPQAPMPPQRPEEAPQRTAPATPAPAQQGGARQNIERLREFSRPTTAARKAPSLRHTGLLRPVSVMEPAVIPMPPIAGDNSGRARADSATTARGIDNGRAAVGAQVSYGEDGATENR